jgi:hypothetical protein
LSLSSCRPPQGKTFLTIGQDFFSIQEYIQSQYNASLHRQISTHNNINSTTNTNINDSSPEQQRLQDFVPAATMGYTDIHQLRGLEDPADYGSGIEYIQGTTKWKSTEIRFYYGTKNCWES